MEPASSAPGHTPSGPASGTPRVIAVVPAYNEAARVVEVLDGLHAHGLTSIVVVNDGSTDGTGALVDTWMTTHPQARAIHLPQNAGKSAALRAVWATLREDVEAGRLSADTLIVGVDADGQHDLRYLQLLIDRIQALGVDAVVARRDLSYHGLYKRLGNRLMTAIGSICAGQRLHDIECGYRVVRLGPLLAAQRFYRGAAYSEAAELTVVLARLGYHLDNTFEVHVPDGRTRTRLSDAARHVVAMGAAWYRVACWRDAAEDRHSTPQAIAASMVLAGFLAFLAAMLLHPFYLGNDSAQSYAHVWFLARAIFSGEGIPLRMPMLEAGRAFTFPYGAIPWLPAAFLRPLLGDWAVTASMVLGAGVLIAGIWRWLPRTRSPLLTALLVLNPQVLGGLAQFQLPTFWAIGLACFAAAAFARAHPARGALLGAAAMYAHPLIGGAALALAVLVNAEQQRRVPLAQIAGSAAAVALALPAIAMLLRTPLVAEVGAAALVGPAVLTLKRVSIVAWAWAASRFMPQALRLWPALVLAALLVIGNDFRHVPPVGLWERSTARFPDYVAEHRVETGAVYRVLVPTNHEDGMVELLQAGATLGQEFFDESVRHTSWDSTEAYRCFLAQKRVDRVLVSAEFAARPWTNEIDQLDALAVEGAATLAYRGPAGTLEYRLAGAAPACGGH